MSTSPPPPSPPPPAPSPASVPFPPPVPKAAAPAPAPIIYDVIPFTPSPSANFQFQATLDGALYIVIVTFNAYAQRYYVNIYDLTGAPVLTRPVVGSPSFYNISLTDGYFDTSIIFREANQTFEIPGIPPVPLPAIVLPPAPPPPPPAPATDPYFSNVVLLLHFDNGAGSDAYLDSSLYDQEIQVQNATTQESSIVRFGPSSVQFNGTNQYLQSLSTAYALSSGQDFTIEVQVYWRGVNASPHIFQLDSGGVLYRMNLFLEFGNIYLNIEAGGVAVPGISAPFGFIEEWTALAVTCASGVVSLWINGALAASATAVVPTGLDALAIGYQPRPTDFNSDYFDGYMDEFRYTVGVARYTAPYTPQAVAFPDS